MCLLHAHDDPFNHRSTSDDGTCSVWTTDTHTLKTVLPLATYPLNPAAPLLERMRTWVTSCEFSRNGKRLAACGYGHSLLSLWRFARMSVSNAEAISYTCTNDMSEGCMRAYIFTNLAFPRIMQPCPM